MKKALLIFGLILLAIIFVSGVLTLLVRNRPTVPFEDRIALVKIEGVIYDSKEAVEEIRKHAKDSSVKAIVLRVNSPGGGVAPSQEIYEEVARAVEKKPVVVSMATVAASGGYYISAPASRILSNPGTLTGSIGVIMEVPNLSGLMDKIGVKTEVIKSGRHKDLASVFRGIGPEEREILQGVMDNIHDQFIKAVAKGRKMKEEKVREIADGRVFSGQQALAAGLVDELGNQHDAVMAAAKLAGIEGEPKVVTKPEKSPFMNLLDGKFPGKISDLFATIEFKYLLSP